jgi:hypothetical protein
MFGTDRNLLVNAHMAQQRIMNALYKPNQTNHDQRRGGVRQKRYFTHTPTVPLVHS